MPQYSIYAEKRIKDDGNTERYGLLGPVRMSKRAEAILDLTGPIPFTASALPTKAVDVAAHETTVYKKQGDPNGDGTLTPTTVQRRGFKRAARAAKQEVQMQRIILPVNRKTGKGNQQVISISFPEWASDLQIGDWLGEYIPDAKKIPNTADDLMGTWKTERGSVRLIPTKAEAANFTLQDTTGSEAVTSAADLAAKQAKRGKQGNAD